MKGLLQFIKGKTFLKHFILYLVAFALLCWIITFWLSSYTSHGESIKVPDFKGIKLNGLDNFITDKKVRYLVIDSLYDLKAAPGSVVKQEPLPNEEVKEGRIIYLYVNSVMPPSVVMPKLIDRSLRQAQAMLTTYGLKLGKVKFVPDQCANCVLDQLVKGKRIVPGEVIAKATVVSLVVGKGLSDEEVGIPCLYGMSRKEALAKLADESLGVGLIKYDTKKDTAKALVYRQSPGCGRDKTLKMGTSIDLYLTTDKNKIPLITADSSTAKPTDDDKNFDK